MSTVLTVVAQEGIVMEAAEPVTDVLVRGGWFAGRRVDASDDVRALIDNGLDTWPGLETILAEFTGLELHYMRAGHSDSAWFSSARALRLVDPWWARRYGQELGVRFAPIGCSNGDYLTLYATEGGSFYGGFDRDLTWLGDSVPDMIDALMTNRLVGTEIHVD